MICEKEVTADELRECADQLADALENNHEFVESLAKITNPQEEYRLYAVVRMLNSEALVRSEAQTRFGRALIRTALWLLDEIGELEWPQEGERERYWLRPYSCRVSNAIQRGRWLVQKAGL